ncbi:MAG: hypothetical protein AMXMBFR33_49710 [Candidatus Xenobia bacterium]
MSEPFDWALDQLRSRFPTAQTLLVLIGQEKLEVQAAHGVDPRQVFTTAPLSLSLLEKVRTTGEPLLTSDVRREKELQDTSSLALSGIRAVCCVPLRDSERKVQGLLYADQRMAPRTFDRTDLFKMVQLARELERRLGWSAPTRPAPVARPLPALVGPPRMLAGRGRVIFLRSLATMLGVGIPLARALAMLAEQREGNQLSQASLTVLREVEQGRPLSEGMKACGTGCFTPFQLQLVRVGEKSGSLLAVLDELAKHEEQSRALTLKVRSALTYPLVMFVVCTLLLLIVPPLMVQGPLRALTEMGGDTPLLTRVVMGVTGFMVTPLGMLLLLLGLGASLFSLWQALRRPESRLWLHRRLLGLGPVGHGLRMLALARFSRSLAVMVRTGVQLLHALPLALATTADPVLLEQTSQTMRAMQDGADLSEALALGGYFPRGFVSVLRSAEETGRLERTLHWVAGIYELELESSLEMACAMIEPILMLGMGITAGVIALAVMLPLVKLVQAL